VPRIVITPCRRVADYVESVRRAGGDPVVLDLATARAPEQLAAADGLLLTGGGDIDPGHFGEALHGSLHDVVPARDALEIEATCAALEGGRPILAVCRGLQLLNVALGGTLHQDVASAPGTPIRHSQSEPRDQPSHKVKVMPASRLAEVLGVEELDVNSMHHQAVKGLGRGLVPVAWAPDEIVEGLELDDRGRFVLGVQWHPEELVGQSEPARRLFAALVRAADRR
jgi:putative glutamine amidotransferase